MSFVLEKIYAKVFQLGEHEIDLLHRTARKLWTGYKFIKEQSNEPIRIASIGYGSGWRDLPILLALRDILKDHAQKSGQPARLIHVLAIEPDWDKQAEFSDGELEWHKPSQFDSNSDFTPVLIGIGDGIQIDLFKSRIETWMINRQKYASGQRWDAVMSFCVLHLLDDWKYTVDFFLKELKTGGAFLFSETPGSVNAFDGFFRNPPKAEDRWEQVWRAIYKERNALLLPITKIVAPRDLTFLKNCLGEAGYSSPRQMQISVNSSISKNDLKLVIESTKEGPDAKTLGAIRINDKKRAAHFVESSLKILDQYPDTNFSFETGYRFFSYKKPRKTKFLSSVAKCACSNSTSEAIERKSRIKRELANHNNVTVAVETPTEQAVATILHDMREALALSHDTMMVATTKEDGNYKTAIQLVPLSIVGTSELRIEQARKFISRHAIYLSERPEKHLSHIFDTRLGDLSVEVTAVAESTYKIAPTVQVTYSADGDPCYIRLQMPQRILEEYRNEVSQEFELFLGNKTAHLLDAEAYPGWNYQTGFDSFYVKAVPPKIKASLANVRMESGDLLLDELRRITNDKTDHIKQPISQQLCAQGLSSEDVEALTEALINSLRLALLDWRDAANDSLPWRSCVYIMRKTTGKSGPTGVGILLLLSDSDFALWGNMKASPSNLPLLVNAVEPFLTAIQEIESTVLIREEGERTQRYRFAHDAKGMILTILFDKNFDKLSQPTQDTAHLLNHQIFLWNSSRMLPANTHEVLDLEKCSQLSRRLAFRHLLSKIELEKSLQTDIPKDEEISIRSKLRTLLYQSKHSGLNMFSDELQYSQLRGCLETRWRGVLESVLICSLRQSLCHSAICDERLKFSKCTLSVQLHSEQVITENGGGVSLVIEERCIDQFAWKSTTEGQTISQLVGLCSNSPDALKLSWDVTPLDNNMFLSSIKVFDPTGRMLP